MKAQSIKNNQKARFVAVGGVNTVIDFGVLFFLSWLGMPAIGANTISTGLAFSFSFFANRNFTFAAHNEKLRRQITLFIIATLFGLWVLQPIIITIFAPLGLLVGKIIATIITLIWNYTLYSRVVFTKRV